MGKKKSKKSASVAPKNAPVAPAGATRPSNPAFPPGRIVPLKVTRLFDTVVDSRPLTPTVVSPRPLTPTNVPHAAHLLNTAHRPSPAKSMAMLVILSVTFGIAVYIQGWHQAPGTYLPRASKLTGQRLQQRQGVNLGWYGTLRPLFFLVDFYEHASKDKTARSVSVLILLLV